MSSSQYTEEQYQEQIKSLIELVNRLGNASRGVNPEIDTKLAKIRSISNSGSANQDQLYPLMMQVSETVRREQANFEQQIQKTHHFAAEALRVLLELEQVPAHCREQARELIAQINTPMYAHGELLSLLYDVLNLYCQTMQDSSKFASAQVVQVSSSEAPSITALKDELSNALATVDFNERGGMGLVSLRQQLMQQTDAETLLKNSLQALRIVIRGVNDERQSAQHFLATLNDALESVGIALSRALQTHEMASSVHNELDKQFEQQLKTLAEAVDPATSLGHLKAQVHQQVVTISSTLARKLEVEAAERKKLHTELYSMQARLEDVESEVREYKHKLNEHKSFSLQDGLTRLPNRVAFEERLQLEYQRWQSYAAPLSVGVVGVDNLTPICATYGQVAGDKTLQVIANMLKKSLRESDFACRYEAGEFVIIFPQTATEQAMILLDKARNRIRSIPFKFKQESISITLSAGVSSFVANDSPTRVFERAKQALQQAQEHGPDRICQQ